MKRLTFADLGEPTNRACRLIVARSFIICFAMLCGFGNQASHGQSLDGAFKDIIKTAQKRVVKIYGAGAGRVESYSTGIIISDDGMILTRQGVFLEGNQVRVTTHDGKTHLASVLRRNREIQTALLKIPVETPDHFSLAEKQPGEKGDWVVALSNAFKVADKDEPLTVTLGVISLRSTIDAKLNKRDVAYRGPIVLIDCITSNPGAAGGAVVTAEGKLVGMIGTVIESSETNTRLNYAVPSDHLRKFVSGELEKLATANADDSKKPKVKLDLGIRMFRMGGKRGPAYVDKVLAKSPAAEIGMRPDDLVISLAGKKINSVQDFNEVMEELEQDQEIIIIFKRDLDLIRVPVKPVKK